MLLFARWLILALPLPNSLIVSVAADFGISCPSRMALKRGEGVANAYLHCGQLLINGFG